MKRTLGIFTAVVLMTMMAMAQSGTPAAQPAPKAEAGAVVAPGPGRHPRNVRRREIRIVRERDGSGDVMYLRRGGMGKWWKNAQLVKELGITDAQVQQMEKIFLDYRLKLVDLKGNLEKAEIELDPMMNAAQPDEQAVLAQIDRVASARAELEKSNARMNFAIRRVLTAEQWKNLQSKKAEMGEDRVFMRRFNLPAPPPDAPGPPEPPPAPPDED